MARGEEVEEAGGHRRDDWRDGSRFAHLGRRRLAVNRGPNDEWLVDFPDEVARHVETLQIHSSGWAQRNLTIDLVLPRRLGRGSWVLPVTRLEKSSPTSFIDLRDETGRSVALPTRAELAAMTCAALRERVLDLGVSPTEREVLDAALTTLVYQEPDHAQIGLALILEAAARHRVRLPERLEETLRQLQGNSIVWLRLSGPPGRRRVIKLSYNISLYAPVIPARRPVERRMRRAWTLKVSTPEGRIDWLKTMRRLRARFTGRMGWDAIDLFLERPFLQDPRSYHLQLSLPDGLQITELSLDRDDPQDPAQISDRNRHLYLRTPRPRTNELVRIKIRAQRRGFLNASAACSLVLAGLLWLFAANASQVSASDALAPGAAVLLIAPALMALLVSRPGESAIAGAALTGIRTALGLSAAASFAAAAALAGARVTSGRAPTFWVCAGVATLCFASVLVAWLGAIDIVRKHANRARRFWCGEPQFRRRWAFAGGTAAAILLAAWSLLVLLTALGLHPVRAAILLAAVPLPTLSIWDRRKPGAPAVGMIAISLSAILASISFAAVLAWHGFHAAAPEPMRIVAVAVGGTLAVVAILTMLAAELAPVESLSSWTSERRPLSVPNA